LEVFPNRTHSEKERACLHTIGWNINYLRVTYESTKRFDVKMHEYVKKREREREREREICAPLKL